MLQEVQATLTWSIPNFRRQTNKLTSPVFGPAVCTWELSLYPEGHGATRDTHMGLFLDVVKTDQEKQLGDAHWSRAIKSFRLSVMRKDSRTPVVMKEREPDGLEGFGKGFSHPRSWGWAALLPLSRIAEAATSDGTVVVQAEVVWQQKAELVGLLESRTKDLPSSGNLLFSWRLADVKFVVLDSEHGGMHGKAGLLGHGHSVATESDEESLDEDGVAQLEETQFGDGSSTTTTNANSTMYESEAHAREAAEEERHYNDMEMDHDPIDFNAGDAARPATANQPSSTGDPTNPTPRPSSTSSSTASLQMAGTTPTPTTVTPHLPSAPSGPSAPASTTPAARSTTMSPHASPHHSHHIPTTIPAHRAILASRSDYFSTMFSSGLRESFSLDSPHQPSIVEIRDFSPAAVRGMLEFLYTGRLSPETQPQTLPSRSELIRLADRYQLSALHKYVAAMILEKDLTLDVALDILELADVYSSASEDLKAACLGYVRENIAKLKHRESFREWVRTTERRDLMVELFALM